MQGVTIKCNGKGEYELIIGVKRVDEEFGGDLLFATES